MRALLANITAYLLVMVAQLVTAVRPLWRGSRPEPIQRIYCPNHTSNGDFVLVWTALPYEIRRKTRPVAASDYWLKSKLRAFIGRDVFRAILINRDRASRIEDPIALMVEKVDEGDNIIIFPEGARNQGEEPLLPVKTGIFHLATQRPHLEFVPVWINNLNRALPKGEVVPLPLLCTVSFGTPIKLAEDEPKQAFLDRMRDGLLEIAPKKERDYD